MITILKNTQTNYIFIALLSICIVVNSYVVCTTTKGILFQIFGIFAICICIVGIYFNSQSIKCKHELIKSDERIAKLSAEIDREIQGLRDKQ
jgi:ABC-type bacteriocin/lantibiotic exporter with double-glycine peptidase domain